MNKSVLTMAIAGAVLAAVAVSASGEAAKDAKVKCFGVAKAHHNGCKGNNHGCAGEAKTDNDPNEWMMVDNAEACTKMGGKMEAAKK
jgi:uncharacterized membrane protein